MCVLVYALSLHFFSPSIYFMYKVQRNLCLLALKRQREKKERNYLLQKNERTFSSSTAFGICIFFANRQAIFLAFTQAPSNWRNKSKRNIRNTKKNQQQQQYLQRKCRKTSWKMLHDAILVRCGLSIAGSKFSNRCLPNSKLLCAGLYIFLPMQKGTNKQKKKKSKTTWEILSFSLPLEFFSILFLLCFAFAMLIFIRKCLLFIAQFQFRIVRFIGYSVLSSVFCFFFLFAKSKWNKPVMRQNNN